MSTIQTTEDRLRYDLAFDIANQLIKELGWSRASQLPSGLAERLADIALARVEMKNG